jgi:nucleotide-binding universal stress UspA family protein
MRTPAVVTGTAGDGSGTTVVEWAAREALRRRRPLRIVHVVEGDPGGRTGVESAWEASAAMMRTAADRVRSVAPGLEIRSELLAGHPADRLLELSEDAELMVVGYRGGGGFAGLRLGSVTRRLATRASAPVVVVRGEPRAGPIVAGVDDSPTAEHVLDAAFAAATACAVPLIVIRALGPAVHLWPPAVRPAGIPAPVRDDDQLASLDERIAPWLTKFPNVRAQTRVTAQDSVAALVGASAEARLVVVGSHGRGPLRRALLGSTGQELLQHAHCPVLVARPRHQ